MNTKTKGLMIGGCSIALVAVGFAMLRSMSEMSDGAPASDAPRATAATAAAGRFAGPRAARAARQLRPGTKYVYEIESSRALRLHADQGPGQPPRALALSGRLSIAVVSQIDDGFLLRLALDEVRSGGAGGAGLPGATGGLTGAFYAVIEPSGKLASFQFTRGLEGAERATLKGLASALQLVVPDPDAAEWRTTEQDASGEYEAAYRAAGGAIHKAKERFVRARGPRGLQPIKDAASYTVASAIDFELDASGWPRSVSEDETLTVKAGAMRIEATSKTAARLTAIETAADLAQLVAAEQGALEAEPEVDAAGFATARRRADEGLVDGASFATLLGGFAGGDVKLRNRTMARMAALFRLEPEAAAQAADAILRGRLDTQTTKRLIGALGGAGTAEAQAALASVLGEGGASSQTRSDAAAALGITKHPTAESKQALLAAAAASDGKVASTAALGLGNLTKRMNEESGDAADAIAALIQGLAGASSDEERILYLDALGNSGDARALASIEPYLAHAETRVRAAAVEALRFMAGVDARLMAALGDPAAQVRRAAAGALAYHAITPMQSLVTAMLKQDPDVGTRLALVGSLQLRKRQEPALLELLQWSAANDPAAEVKGAAKTALAS
ncbi:MAG TPA: HEAT repeat domain-containing protein [Kofleriaceae bacterium]|nr:HEAT repeat domain-containing protein [Kofleriaceae bacterium]